MCLCFSWFLWSLKYSTWMQLSSERWGNILLCIIQASLKKDVCVWAYERCNAAMLSGCCSEVCTSEQGSLFYASQERSCAVFEVCAERPHWRCKHFSCHWLIKTLRIGRSVGNWFSLIPLWSAMQNIDHFGMNDLNLPLASTGRQTGFHQRFFFLLKPRACHLNIKMFGTFTYPKEAGLWFLLRNSCYLNCWRFIVLCSAMPYTTILIALQWITRNTLWKYHSRYSMFYL